MSNKQGLLLSVALTASLVFAACSPAATPAAPTAAPAQPTTAQATSAVPTAEQVQPTTVITANVATPLIKVGLVTDTGGVNDHAYNQLAWEGIQKAATELGFQAKYIESRQHTDFETNIEELATEGYNVIITVGSQMGDATALKARQHPNIKFAIVDQAYAPTTGSQSCADTVKDCYTDGGLTNITSLMFAEDQLGFLAGVLAGGMSRSGFVCSISSTPPPASNGYVISFRAGAVWQVGESNLRSMNNYINIQTSNPDIPTVTDTTQGKETALKLIGAGCDVVFAIAADGALLAARESNLMAIGTNVDEYNTDPAAQDALLSSAQKNVDVAVYTYLKTVADGSVKAGISVSNLQNDGVGLAPFHDWDSKIPADLKSQLQKASDGIRDGSITIDGSS